MNINRSIFNTIIEMIFMISFVIITIPIWQLLDKSSFATVAASYDNYKRDDVTLAVEKQMNIDNLTTIYDSDRFKTDYYSLVNVINLNDQINNYNLYLVINNNNTLNTDYLKVSFNDKTHFLKDLIKQESNNKTYYLLEQNDIESKSINNYKIYIWLDKETPNTEQGKTFELTFDIEKNML